jgi:hypothetical protein
MNSEQLMAFITIVVIPTMLIIYLANRFFRLRERKLDIEALNAAEKAAQYASHSREIEERLRVVEQIVTDGGVETARSCSWVRSTSHATQQEVSWLAR